MLNKKVMKVLSIVLLVVVVFMTMGSSVFAAGTNTTNIADTFDPNTTISNGNAKNLANTVLGALTWIGVAIAIGMLIFLGIKYVTSSPDGKADLKGKLGVYVLGLVLILGAAGIVKFLESIITGAI